MRTLNARHKLFLELMLEHGFYDALKMCDFSRRRGYRILSDKRAKEYLVSIYSDAAKQLGLTYADILQMYLNIAQDKKTPPRSKIDALDRVKIALERAQDDPNGASDNKGMLMPSRIAGALRAAQETVYQDVTSEAEATESGTGPTERPTEAGQSQAASDDKPDRGDETGTGG